VGFTVNGITPLSQWLDTVATQHDIDHSTATSNLKRFEQIELQAKLLNYFLGSNKSNINQAECKDLTEGAEVRLP